MITTATQPFTLNRTNQQASQPTQFSGAADALFTTATRWMQRGGHGLSGMLFLQDTFQNLFPKVPAMRSANEAFEVSFLELVESAAFYFTAPLFAEHVVSRMFRANSPVTKELLMTPGHDLAKALAGNAPLLEQTLAKKAGVIGAAVGLAVAAEYSISFLRNIITAKGFKRDRFSDVLNYSQGSIQTTAEESHVVQKAKKRLKQTALAYAGVFGASAALALWGHKTPSTRALSKWLVENMDFNFKKGVFGLQLSQLLLAVVGGVVSYIDAGRDKLEKVEVALRLAITAPMTFYGLRLMSDVTLKGLSRWMPDVIQKIGDFADDTPPNLADKVANTIGKLIGADKWLWLSNDKGHRLTGLVSLQKSHQLALEQAAQEVGVSKTVIEPILEQFEKVAASSKWLSPALERFVAEAKNPQLLEAFQRISKPYTRANNILQWTPLLLGMGLTLGVTRLISKSITPRLYQKMNQEASKAEPKPEPPVPAVAALGSFDRPPIATVSGPRQFSLGHLPNHVTSSNPFAPVLSQQIPRFSALSAS